MNAVGIYFEICKYCREDHISDRLRRPRTVVSEPTALDSINDAIWGHNIITLKNDIIIII